MEMMNELIEKYFRGETSLSEEKVLKQYFSTGNVSPEHEIYRALFEVFEQETKETAIHPVHVALINQRSIKRIWFQTFAITGIAATLLLLVWIKLPQSSDNFAVISGNRIDNTEYVQRYTLKKFNKVNTILARSMKPMQNFNKVRKGMEPLQSLSDVRDKMEDLQDKLQFNK